MELTDLYQKGEELIRQRDIGVLLDGVGLKEAGTLM